MNDIARPDRRKRLEQLRKKGSIESDFVARHVNNYNAERQCFEIVLVLETAISCDEHFTLELFHQHMVLQVLPAEIEKGPDVVFRECFNQPRIDGGVYDDAHAN
jgi:hypothetical protein